MANVSFTFVANGLDVTFTGPSTSDNPPIVQYQWNFGAGVGLDSTAQNPEFTFPEQGTYTVTLTYTDYVGDHTVTQSITVAPLEDTTDFTFSQPNSDNPLVVQFTSAVTSTHPPIVGWAWDFGDGETSGEQNPIHTYEAAGDYTVTLQATDYGGPREDSATKQVTVTAGGPVQNTPPVANFTYVASGLVANFADASSDSDGAITARSWDFGDGHTSTAASPSHTYAAAGTYAVVLTITDNDGAATTKTASVVIGTVADGSDTYTLKGFIGFGQLADNTPNTVAPIGELSVKSQTFAKDRKIFGGSSGGSNPSSMDLTVFSSFDATEAPKDVPSDYASQILTIGAWIYTQALNGAFTADSSVFQQAFLAQYGAIVKTVTVGTMAVKGNVWLPSSVQFYFINPSSVLPSLTTKSRIKLWFADGAFQTEYDEYALVFIPPLPTLDIFFQSADTIKTALAQQTVPGLMTKMQVAAGNNPYTLSDAHTYNWIDPTNSNNFIPTDWTYLLYGEAGNNVDVIKQELAQYILDNSTHPRDEWAEIFPDIFSSTEFILTPLYTQVAIPNATLDPGVYSPTVNHGQALNFALATAIGSGYTPEFVGNVLNIFGVPYKSLAMLAVGGPENRNGIVEFAKRWPDYLNVSSTHVDFDRMSQDTQGFVLLMQSMLKVAETMTTATDLPTGMTRLTRKDAQGNPVLYLVASYDAIDYLMVAKSWMVAKYGQSTNTAGSIGISYDGIFVNGAYQLLNQAHQMTLFFAAENAKGPLKYEILDTSITDATINANTGMFVGTFPAAGLFSLTLKLTDANGYAVQRTFAFNYQQPSGSGGSTTPPLVLSNINAPNGTVGQQYSGSLKITGGKPPYSLYGIATVPAGLACSVQGDTVVLGGTPTAAGNAIWNIAVQDSSGAGGGAALTTSSQFGITVAAGPTS